MSNKRLRVFTWHIHGNYLWYLSFADCDFYVPVRPGGGEGYGGRGRTFPFGENVREIPADEVRHCEVDCILFQTRKNYCQDQYEILSEQQRRLPQVYLEHDPPLDHPTDERHWVDDPKILLVHVTPFNALMWNCGQTPVRVIEHGVYVPPDVQYEGEIERGIVVVNHLASRGRRLGGDIFELARAAVPLDLVGMAAEELGGLGEIFPPRLPAFEARYRFFFNPIRYTSLGLAVCEAMMIGMPVVGLATTQLASVIENGVTGYVDCSVHALVAAMRELLRHPAHARELGKRAKEYARAHFGIERFAREWQETFAMVTAS